MLLWAIAQGGTPSLHLAHVEGEWRANLRAGATTLAVRAENYGRCLAALLDSMRASYLRAMVGA
jgi:hypothetical protein